MAQWNPLHDLVTLQDRMNRLFEDASQRRGEANPIDDVETSDWYPAADVYEENGAYTVAVDLPGIDRSTLDIGIEDNRLSIRGNRVAREGLQNRAECPTGKFLRVFSVPSHVDQDAIRAEYKDGVLRVRLPRRAERKAQRVEIKIS
jgi:HSP20 family protein